MPTIGGWALDVSNHSGPFGVATAQRMVAEGWNILIASTYNQTIARAQLEAAAAAGMEIQAYIYMRAELDPVAQVRDNLAKLAGISITKVWFDFEGEPTDSIPNDWRIFGGPTGVEQFIQRTVDAPRAVPAGIYTRRDWWEHWTGNSTTFSPYYPLWNATNDQLGDLSFTPYGGWTACAMEQFAFDILVAGVKCDFNAVALVTAPPVPPSPPAPVDDYVRGWRDHAEAVRLALESIEEPWNA